MQIRYKDYKIKEHGCILLDEKDTEIIFELEVDAEIVCRFLSDDKNIGPKTECAVEGKKLIISCTNYNNPLGSGFQKMLPIGKVDGIGIYLMLWSYLLGDDNVRRVEYTLYEEKTA